MSGPNDPTTAFASARQPVLLRATAWLTPRWCRIFLFLLLLAGVVSRLHYLNSSPPIDLAGDEAHYWDWSRQLQLSYYSKGPLVALIIRASTELFGSQMPAVRYPAIILAVLTSLCTYWLTRYLLKSERLALGVVVLTHLVPIFVVGSMLMTIDPPFYFCFAAATCLAAKALLENRRWPWPLIGVLVGIGFLAKYAALLWFVGLFAFLLWEPTARRWLRSPWPYLAIIVSLLFTAPVVVWNWQNDFVTFKHVARQTGATDEAGFDLRNFLEFVGGQAGVLGPGLAAAMIGGVILATRRNADRSLRYLLCIGGTFFALTLVSALRAKAQLNWPAPAYFTGMILAGYFISTRLHLPTQWKTWRWVIYPTIALGLVVAPAAHDMTRFYPAMAWVHARFSSEPFSPRNVDPSTRLMGFRELGLHLGGLLKQMQPGAFVVAENYQVAGSAAFYIPGQPKTYYAGSYFADPERRARYCQYDLWPDRSLEPTNLQLLGKDALYIGYITEDFKAAFESVERLADLRIERNGVFVRRFIVYRCVGFKGLPRPRDKTDF